VEELVERVRTEKPSILLISVLMLPSALEVKPVVEQIRKTDHSVKVLVGGAPFRFDKQLWREVGADAAGHNAGDAVSLVQKYLPGGDGR
jgi:methanogenic corrinoid protein MtbC1